MEEMRLLISSHCILVCGHNTFIVHSTNNPTIIAIAKYASLTSIPSTIHFVWRKKSAMICAKSNRNSIDILLSCFRYYYCSESVY